MKSPGGTCGTDAIRRLLGVVQTLRSEGGCPWDREQTLESLKPYLIEESYELLDAVDSGDPGRHVEELGDVLLQVLLQAQIRAEEGRFTFDDVAGRLAEKLIRRHPHVFGEGTVRDSGEVLRNWEAIKASEGADGSSRPLLDGIPRQLPALQKAQRVQERAARVGFDWPDAGGVLDKIEEEIGECRDALASGDRRAVDEEIGDLLFSLVNLCRREGLDAEDALRRTVNKFVARFGEMERRVLGQGRALRDCTLAEMDAHWAAVKEGEAPREPGGTTGV